MMAVIKTHQSVLEFYIYYFKNRLLTCWEDYRSCRKRKESSEKDGSGKESSGKECSGKECSGKDCSGNFGKECSGKDCSGKKCTTNVKLLSGFTD